MYDNWRIFTILWLNGIKKKHTFVENKSMFLVKLS